MATQISVIGQGYVGLPLALAICNAGYSTIGIDSSVFRISELQSSKSGIEDISDNECIINDICLRSHPIIISPMAYFFYNFAYSPFKSGKCIIIN